MTEPATLPALLRTTAELWVRAGEEQRFTLSRLGRLVVNDTSFFTRLEERGANTTTATLERFARFLHDPANWPEGLVPTEACELAHRVGVSADGVAPSAGKAGELSSEERAA